MISTPTCFCGKFYRMCDHAAPDDPADMAHFEDRNPTPKEGEAWRGTDEAWEVRSPTGRWPRHFLPYEGATADWTDAGELVRPVRKIDGQWVGVAWSEILGGVK